MFRQKQEIWLFMALDLKSKTKNAYYNVCVEQSFKPWLIACLQETKFIEELTLM